jgi:sugar lactone lactonase YvrE
MRFRTFIMAAVIVCLVAIDGQRASAVGWDRDDFLIFGAPNFPDSIGVFDQNFGFKGYIFTNWVGLQAMNFDQQGRLVAFNTFTREVRVFDPTGAQVGGFSSNTSPMLTSGGDIQVMPDGNYILGTSADGARVFTPQGTFLRQIGSGDSTSIAVLPGHRLWSGNPGTLTMNVFDTDSGLQTGSFTMDQQTRPTYMNFSTATNTVLSIDRDRDAGGIFERDLSGTLVRQFHIPRPQVTCNGATRGPDGGVFGTTSNFDIDVVAWHPDATVAGTFDVYPATVSAARILWAGTVPEPEAVVVLTAGVGVLRVTRRARSRPRKR